MTIESAQFKNVEGFLTVSRTSRFNAGEPSHLKKNFNGWKTQTAFSPSRSHPPPARFKNGFDEALSRPHAILSMLDDPVVSA